MIMCFLAFLHHCLLFSCSLLLFFVICCCRWYRCCYSECFVYGHFSLDFFSNTCFMTVNVTVNKYSSESGVCLCDHPDYNYAWALTRSLCVLICVCVYVSVLYLFVCLSLGVLLSTVIFHNLPLASLRNWLFLPQCSLKRLSKVSFRSIRSM